MSLKRHIYIVGLGIFLAGCANNSPLTPRSSIDPSLPKPQNIRVITSGSSAAFEWDLVQKSSIEGFCIYRANKNGAMEKIATVKDRFSTHFEDQGLVNGSTYQYSFSSYTKDGVESSGSDMVIAKTQPIIESISWIANVDNLPNRAKIVWRPHTNPSVVGYVIQKSDSHQQKWEDAASVKGRLQAEFIDKDVESGKTYFYRVVAKLFDDSRTLASQAVEVKVKKLPLAVESIFATKDLPRQIAISWESPEQKEFSNFRVYRAEKTDGNYKTLLNTTEKKYIDRVDEDGALRYYKVTVVDKDGLESPSLNIATGLTKPLPETPKFTLATIKENRVSLAWSVSNSNELTYRITKKWGSFINKQVVAYNDIRELSFVDKDVDLGNTYTYSIESIDRDGLASKVSDEVELFVPKGL